MTAKDLISRINRIQSFDKLNLLTAGLRLDRYSAAERREIEAAIDARREYLASLLGAG